GAIRVAGLEGRLIDEQVPVREGVVGQETTGPGGVCFALRSLPALVGDRARGRAARSTRVVHQLHQSGRTGGRSAAAGARVAGHRRVRYTQWSVQPRVSAAGAPVV